MINRTNSKLAVAALFAAAAFAGCGGDSDESAAENGAASATQPAGEDTSAEVVPKEPPPTPEEKRIAKTPDGRWATRVCSAIQENTKPVQPPNVQASDPAAVRTSMAEFFQGVSRQLGAQREALASLDGPPAGGDATKAWDKALDNLSDTKRQIDTIRRDLKDTKVQAKADVEKMMADVGKQMQALTQYEGVVADLLASKPIEKALLAEPDCREIGGMRAKQ